MRINHLRDHSATIDSYTRNDFAMRLVVTVHSPYASGDRHTPFSIRVIARANTEISVEPHVFIVAANIVESLFIRRISRIA